MGNPNLMRQPFSHKGPFVANRPFRLNGVDFNHDDPVDISQMAVGPRKIQQLYDARYLRMAGDEVELSKAEVKPETKVDQPLVAGEGQFLFDPSKHAVEKSGKEDWIADEENLLVRITAKAATRLKKVDGPVIVKADEILEWPDTSEDEDPEEGDD